MSMSCYVLYSKTWPVKKEELIRHEKKDVRMVRQICNVRPEDRISAEEFSTRLKLNSMSEWWYCTAGHCCNLVVYDI